MHVLRRTAVATTVMLAAISLGACSSSGSASDSAKDKAPKDKAPIDQANWPAEVPTSGLVKGLELPLESYLPSYADQVAVDTALRTLQTRCMSEYGLTVDLPHPGANPPPHSNAVSIERRYGLSDRAQAQKYGYGLPKELTRSLESVEQGLSGIEVEVLTGRKEPEFAPPKGAKASDGHFGGVPEPARAEHNGKKLHEGGCGRLVEAAAQGERGGCGLCLRARLDKPLRVPAAEAGREGSQELVGLHEGQGPQGRRSVPGDGAGLRRRRRHHQERDRARAGRHRLQGADPSDRGLVQGGVGRPEAADRGEQGPACRHQEAHGRGPAAAKAVK